MQPGMGPDVMGPITTQPMPKPVVVVDEACFPWDLGDMRGATVSATQLGVPGKARSQYEKACNDFKKKKWPEAEQHARDAIEKYSRYPAAWVMLGQVLESQQKMDEAHEACTKPIKIDPTYLPPYLCLAGLLDHEKKWEELLSWSDRFLGLTQSGDLYANYYRGIAQFHLQKLPEAQKSISQAIAFDAEHHQPGLYFLLAQIFGAQGHVADAGVQIQQFVKYSNSTQDKDDAKEYLSELESQQKTKD
jgi:tetratricopeptide (TPR) repeat protein